MCPRITKYVAAIHNYIHSTVVHIHADHDIPYSTKPKLLCYFQKTKHHVCYILKSILSSQTCLNLISVEVLSRKYPMRNTKIVNLNSLLFL